MVDSWVTLPRLLPSTSAHMPGGVARKVQKTHGKNRMYNDFKHEYCHWIHLWHFAWYQKRLAQDVGFALGHQRKKHAFSIESVETVHSKSADPPHGCQITEKSDAVKLSCTGHCGFHKSCLLNNTNQGILAISCLFLLWLARNYVFNYTCIYTYIYINRYIITVYQYSYI